jgi:pSer/pThr/pTyr-binding forkhead associated (FHA) protein
MPVNLPQKNSVITLTLLHPSKSIPLQHWTFEEETVIRIGRGMDNDVVLYSAVVSRRHLEIRKTDSKWELENLGANGTFFDGKPVQKKTIIDGMIIRLASSGPQIQINIKESSSERRLTQRVASVSASVESVNDEDLELDSHQDEHKSDKETMTS